MKDGPAFQMYADLFFIDTAEWEPYDVGIYLRLLLCQWANGSISSDKKVLQKVSGSTPKRFQKASKNVLDKFVLGDDGRFRNLKLEEVRLKQRQYREKQRQNAIIGVKKRWNKNIATATPIAIPTAIAVAEAPLNSGYMPNDASSSLSSTSLKQKKIYKRKVLLSDEEWIEQIKKINPWINWDDINREMDTWLLNNPGREKTRKFITNWILKKQKDKPMRLKPKIVGDYPKAEDVLKGQGFGEDYYGIGKSWKE